MRRIALLLALLAGCGMDDGGSLSPDAAAGLGDEAPSCGGCDTVERWCTVYPATHQRTFAVQIRDTIFRQCLRIDGNRLCVLGDGAITPCVGSCLATTCAPEEPYCVARLDVLCGGGNVCLCAIGLANLPEDCQSRPEAVEGGGLERVECVGHHGPKS